MGRGLCSKCGMLMTPAAAAGPTQPPNPAGPPQASNPGPAAPTAP